LQHQIPTADDRLINIRQYRFPQIYKKEINKQVEELLEGNIVKPSQPILESFNFFRRFKEFLPFDSFKYV